MIANMENIIHINKGIISERNQKAFTHSSQKAKEFRNKRRYMKNFLAKNILSEYQKKTHFKALCTCYLNLSDSYQIKNLNFENNKDNNKSEDKHNSFNTLNNKKIGDNIEKINSLKYNSISLCKKRFHKKKKYPSKEMDYLRSLFHNI